MTLQIVAFTVTATFLGVIVRMVRARRLRPKYSFLWLIVGAMIMTLALTPGMMHSAAAVLGIHYPPAMLFLGSTMLLLFIAVHFSWELSRIEERSRTLTEELGLAVARLEALERRSDELETTHSGEPRVAPLP